MTAYIFCIVAGVFCCRESSLTVDLSWGVSKRDANLGKKIEAAGRRGMFFGVLCVLYGSLNLAWFALR